MYDTSIPVLIIGGGPVGLSTALFLAQQGTPSLVIERHPGTSIHPRARGINIRTMELFRQLGMDDAIREAGTALVNNKYFLVVETLAGAELSRFERFTLGGEEQLLTPQVSPAQSCLCAQDELEPILVQAVRKRGGTVRFGCELVSFERDDDGVTAQIKERTTGRVQTIRADYLVAADGAHSTIRQRLHIPTTGRGILAHEINIYFRADLRALTQDRPFIVCYVKNPSIQGVLLSVNNTDRWLLNAPYSPEQGESPADFTPERCQELVRLAVGLPDLVPEILGILPWEAAVRVAKRYQQQRIFLVGDAAHVMPPSGAFGMNTGIHDAHNLAWKLAAVLNGQASPVLLTTYEDERRPVAQLTTEQAGLRLAGNISIDGPGKIEGLIDDACIILGYQYRSSAIIPEKLSTPPVVTLDLHGQPGTRAPHLWVERQGQRISLLDLFTTRFVLLIGPDGLTWYESASHLAAHGLPIDAYRVGPGGDLHELEGNWPDVYGVSAEGAVLIRPDGFVAWRAYNLSENAQQSLETLLLHLLGRTIVA
ncbi:FAD-binding monooxygenase [Reticulibacter mediterranei]|uniref:FAD-binding monooxygenase n=1 Tax=Reticulibacter mediterranei TaxID=2778369 RepID=A0A8J3J280_9CHLR|nr:FAD-dependent oxidoreductase [Reticulibacter mediterranei]GHP01008.1 FAD-binding monooxygenase [Reticulibacter mediterranei]